MSEILLGIYLTEKDETPRDALKYLIAGVMYGGHDAATGIVDS